MYGGGRRCRRYSLHRGVRSAPGQPHSLRTGADFATRRPVTLSALMEATSYRPYQMAAALTRVDTIPCGAGLIRPACTRLSPIEGAGSKRDSPQSWRRAPAAQSSRRAALAAELPEDPGQALLGRQPVVPAIPGLLQAGDTSANGEVLGSRALELIPAQRHGNRRAGAAARGVGSGEGLAAHVHVVVDEDLARALADGPIHRDLLRMVVEHVPADSLTYFSHGVERDASLDGHEDVQAGLA